MGSTAPRPSSARRGFADRSQGEAEPDRVRSAVEAPDAMGDPGVAGALLAHARFVQCAHRNVHGHDPINLRGCAMPANVIRGAGCVAPHPRFWMAAAYARP